MSEGISNVPRRGISALKSAVAKVTVMNVLSRSSVLGAGAPVFVRLDSNRELSAKGDWFAGTARTVTTVQPDGDEAGAADASAEPQRQLTVDVAQDGSTAAVDVPDSRDGSVFHFNRGHGWQPPEEASNSAGLDLCSVPDSHEATLSVSLSRFLKDTAFPGISIAGNEGAIVKPSAFAGVAPSGLSLAVLERSVVVCAGASLRPERLDALRLLWVSRSNAVSGAALPFARIVAALNLLGHVFVPDTFVLDVQVLARRGHLPHVVPNFTFGHLDAKVSPVLATASGAGRTFESLVAAFAQEFGIDAAEQYTRHVRAAVVLFYLPITATGLKPSQEEGLKEVSELSGVAVTMLKNQLLPSSAGRGAAPPTSVVVDEAKAQLVASLIRKGLQGLFRAAASTVPTDAAAVWRLIMLPPLPDRAEMLTSSQQTSTPGIGVASKISPALTGDPRTSIAQLCIDTCYGLMATSALHHNGGKSDFAAQITDTERVASLVAAVEANMHHPTETIAQRMGEAAKGAPVSRTATGGASGGVAAARSAFGGGTRNARAAFEQSASPTSGDVGPVRGRVGGPRPKDDKTPAPPAGLFTAGQGRDRDLMTVRHPFGAVAKYSVTQCRFHFLSLGTVPTPPASFAAQLDALRSAIEAPHGAVYVYGSSVQSDASTPVLSGMTTRLAKLAFTKPAITLTPTHINALACLIPSSSSATASGSAGNADGDDDAHADHETAPPSVSTLSVAEKSKRLVAVLNLPQEGHAKVTDGYTQLSVFAYGSLLTRFQRYRGPQLQSVQSLLRARVSARLALRRRYQTSLNTLSACAMAKIAQYRCADAAEDVMQHLHRQLAKAQLRWLEYDEQEARMTLEREARSDGQSIVRASSSFIGPMFHRLMTDAAVQELEKRREVLALERSLRHKIEMFFVDSSPELAAPVGLIAASRRNRQQQSLGIINAAANETLARASLEATLTARLAAFHAYIRPEERASRAAAARRERERHQRAAMTQSLFETRLSAAKQSAHAREFVEQRKVAALYTGRQPYNVSYSSYWDAPSVAQQPAASERTPPRKGPEDAALPPSTAPATAPHDRTQRYGDPTTDGTRIIPPHRAWQPPSPGANAYSTVAGAWAGPNPDTRFTRPATEDPRSPERVVASPRRATWGRRSS